MNTYSAQHSSLPTSVLRLAPRLLGTFTMVAQGGDSKLTSTVSASLPPL